MTVFFSQSHVVSHTQSEAVRIHLDCHADPAFHRDAPMGEVQSILNGFACNLHNNLIFMRQLK